MYFLGLPIGPVAKRSQSPHCNTVHHHCIQFTRTRIWTKDINPIALLDFWVRTCQSYYPTHLRSASGLRTYRDGCTQGAAQTAVWMCRDVINRLGQGTAALDLVPPMPMQPLWLHYHIGMRIPKIWTACSRMLLSYPGCFTKLVWVLICGFCAPFTGTTGSAAADPSEEITHHVRSSSRGQYFLLSGRHGLDIPPHIIPADRFTKQYMSSPCIVLCKTIERHDEQHGSPSSIHVSW